MTHLEKISFKKFKDINKNQSESESDKIDIVDSVMCDDVTNINEKQNKDSVKCEDSNLIFKI